MLPGHASSASMANASQVAPLDKLSVPLTAVLAFILLNERPSWINWIGILMIAAGAYLCTLKFGTKMSTGLEMLKKT